MHIARTTAQSDVTVPSPLVLILPSVSGPVLAVALIVQQHLTDPFYFVIRFQVCRGVHVLQVPKLTVQRVRDKTQISFLVLLETHRHLTYREMRARWRKKKKNEVRGEIITSAKRK